MAEVSTFYQSQYTGEQLDNILKNVYDAVPLDGSKPMTAPLTIKEVENGYTQLEKNHTQTTDLGTALRDVSKGGSVVALLLKAADQAARLQFGASVYDLIHTGNITGYVKPYADTAQAASAAAESALEGVREAIEAIPEGAATPIVNDLTTGGTSMALSAEMGKKLKSELDTRVNPNLLDNWYFGNPVNQRGQTEYTAAGYTIDRWRLSAAANVVIAGDRILLSFPAISGQLIQYIENSEELFGKTVTLSGLAASSLKSTTITIPETPPSGTIGKGVNLEGDIAIYLRYSGSALYFSIYATSGYVANTAINIRAVKLELGTEQTLAHQDENGNWVLNEIPDYNEQLLRCCMSTADAADTYANNKVTPAAINAVNKAGDTMTGRLFHRPSGLTSEAGFYKNASATTDYGTYVIDRETDSSRYVALRLSGKDQTAIVTFRSIGDTVDKNYTILHAGNKPSGSYTGNGSATSRTIETGGIGNVCVITNAAGSTCFLVTEVGAFGRLGSAGNGHYGYPTVHFVNGIITIASEVTALNANGETYKYQVL